MMSNEITTLSSLAVEINTLSDCANNFANQAVIYAARCGEKLLLAKAQCKHGEFKEWIEKNCSVSYSYACSFMKLAKDMPELLNANVQTSVHLKLNQAISLLNAPEEVKTEVTARIEAGEDVSIKEIQRLKQEQALMKIELDDAHNQLKNIPILSDQYQKLSIKLTDAQVALNEREKMQEQIIDAKVSEARAKILLEKSAEIQRKQKEIDDLETKLIHAKKEQDKAIKDGVAREISVREIEVKQLDYQITSMKAVANELREVVSILDKEHGALKTHQENIKAIKSAHEDIRSAIILAGEDKTPVELIHDWNNLLFVHESLLTELRKFCNRDLHAVFVEGQLLELV